MHYRLQRLYELTSSTGLVVRLCYWLFWTYNFVHWQVHDQLVAEKKVDGVRTTVAYPDTLKCLKSRGRPDAGR